MTTIKGTIEFEIVLTAQMEEFLADEGGPENVEPMYFINDIMDLDLSYYTTRETAVWS